MPIKIKLSTPLSTADIIALTNNNLAAAEDHLTTREEANNAAPSQSSSGRNNAATDEKSGFPLPPLPHQGRSLVAAVTDPMDMSHQAGYKDFLPPPIHLPKKTEKKGSDTTTNKDGSAFLPRMNHDSSSSNMEENSNHDVNQQQQQHPLLPPSPGVEKTSSENESEVQKNSFKRNNDIAPSDDSTEKMHQNQRDMVPVYVYSTLHQQKSWNEMIQLFTKFIEVNGHSNVEQENVKNSTNGDNQSDGDGDDDNEEEILFMLRSWVRELRYIRNADDSPGGEEKNSSKKQSAKQQQRQQQQQHRCDSETLTTERISQLNELSFPWKNNLTQWQKWLDDLMHYRAKHNNGNNCNVPVKFPEHAPLGNFVNRQRVEYKKMLQRKPTTMTPSKMEDLERIGFVWSVREGGHTSWDDRLDELIVYQREHGNTLVPKKYPPNPPLGYWVNEQRFQYQRYIHGKSSTMNKERQERLNSIHFTWSVRDAPREFPEWITLLKEYKSQWGNCIVPLKYEQDASLGTFVNNARTQYKKFQSGLPSNMTQEKIDQLEEIGFVWNVREGRTPWLRRFEELKEYKEKYGDCNVPKKWTENKKLSAWTTKQRAQYKLYIAGKECNLTEEKVDKLTELGLFQPVSGERYYLSEKTISI